MRYRVVCPSAPFENTETDDMDRAADLCYGLAEEYGSAEVRQYNLNGNTQSDGETMITVFRDGKSTSISNTLKCLQKSLHLGQAGEMSTKIVCIQLNTDCLKNGCCFYRFRCCKY